MTKIPQRPSLVAQVAEILLGRIRSGRWTERLPAERRLAEHLQVSRSTLRDALQLLRRDGFLEVRRKRYWIAKKTSREPTKPEASRLIVWLSPEPLDQLPQYKLFQIDELRRRLQGLDYTLEVHVDERLRRHPVSKALEETIRLTGAACWVLNMATVKVQRWFSERRIPAIVAGTRHEGVRLPSIDFDYGAVSRHAAGMFLQREHRRVAFVFPRYNLRGDTISKEEFLGALRESKWPAVEPILAGHDGTVKGICSALNLLFDSRKPPTALYVSYPQDVLTVLSHLAQLHVRVPQDVSLISRHDDPFLHHLTPSIAAYEFRVGHYAARLAQMAIRTARLGPVSTRHALAMGVFRKGDSLAERR